MQIFFFSLGIADPERGKHKMGSTLLPSLAALPRSGMLGINQAPAELLRFQSITKFCLEEGSLEKRKCKAENPLLSPSSLLRGHSLWEQDLKTGRKIRIFLIVSMETAIIPVIPCLVFSS